ncbi:MAG TPA: class I SAM-dependent methyltransferase [Bryobacteraceae bacterium]|nr:class I SAM-dependent methyltransferase [Bryobacteraceae bacterium]
MIKGPRYGYGRPPHPQLYALIEKERPAFEEHLRYLPSLFHFLAAIPMESVTNSPALPCWNNGQLPGLDAAALYSFICLNRPQYYLEFGSGAATRFARQAIEDQVLSTEIICVDPDHHDLDSIADVVIPKDITDLELDLLDELNRGDILYLDPSHLVGMATDSTLIFLEILPRLKPGVLVHLHDIYLPYDYPPEWADRNYGDQYLLAAWLLSGNTRSRIRLANTFISNDSKLSSMLLPEWIRYNLSAVERHGGSFWLEMI